MSQNPFLTTRATLIMGGITALSAITTDIFLPATGVIARDFGVHEAQGAWLMGVYFLAYGVGQLFWGLFSDAYGRKFALQLSLLCFTVVSIACACAPSFDWLLALRALQGLCAGAPTICRAMVRDVATGNEAGRILATLGAVLTASTMIAPIMGSGLLILFDWPAIFLGLAIFALGYVVYNWQNLPDTPSVRRPERMSFAFVIPNALPLLKRRGFSVPMLQAGFVFAGYGSLLSVGAIVTEINYGVSPEAFGTLFVFAALSNTTGALIVRKWLKEASLRAVNKAGVALVGAASCATAALVFLDPNLALFWSVICLYVLGFGMVHPTATAITMDHAGDLPGFAAALNGFFLVAMGALGTGFAAAIFQGGTETVAISMSMFGALTVATLWFAPQDN